MLLHNHSSDSSMDDCNESGGRSLGLREKCSDSSMDDCNENNRIATSSVVRSSDSSMDDCNPVKKKERAFKVKMFRFLYGRL